MPQGLQTLVALLLLLPGFLSARIVNSISARGQQSDLERVIEALILSFVNYVFYVLIFGTGLPIEWSPVFQVHRWRVAFLFILACVIGLFWGVARSRDWILQRLRAWKLTERTSREFIWNDVFSSLEGTVQVGLKDGRSLIGWIGRYSDSGGEHSLFLERASWVQEDGMLVEIDGRGILLTDKAEIDYVMFLDDKVQTSSKV